MLVKVLSDLHLGVNGDFRYVDHYESVCVLAGDICTGMRGVDWALKNIPDHIQVIYVPGNHEYYGHEYNTLNSSYLRHNDLNTNVKVLINDILVIGDVEFVGTTLWTDFCLYNNPEKHRINWYAGLNDSRYIRRDEKTINPIDFEQWNGKAMAFLRSVANTPTNNKRVLVTHYCPEFSVAPRYQNDPLTPGFATKIPGEIHKQFVYHIHGHTHDSMDYECAYGTRVVCNPKGYGYENGASFNEELVLDI